MRHPLLLLFPALIFTLLLPACKSKISQTDMALMVAARKDTAMYKEVRAEFCKYASARDSENLLRMMSAYSYEKTKSITFFEEALYPYFSDYKEVTGVEIMNLVTDEEGDVGYTLYGFILTTKDEKKPYTIYIIEKRNGFAVKEVILNVCFKGLHVGC